MADQQFVTAYDVLDQAYDDRMWLLVGLVVLVVVSLVAILDAKRHRPRRLGRGSVIVVFSSLTLGLGWMVLGAFAERSRCLTWALNNEFTVVEGNIEDYKPMPSHEHGKESFTVGGVFFQYSDYDNLSNGGFVQTASHGGPIRPGLHVRISYHQDRILKVEVAK